MLHLGKGRTGMLGQRDAREALPPHVLNDVRERDDARDALRQVRPVAGPGIFFFF